MSTFHETVEADRDTQQNSARRAVQDLLKMPDHNEAIEQLVSEGMDREQATIEVRRAIRSIFGYSYF